MFEVFSYPFSLRYTCTCKWQIMSLLLKHLQNSHDNNITIINSFFSSIEIINKICLLIIKDTQCMYFMACINITKKSQINTCLLAAEEGLVTCEISADGNISLKKKKVIYLTL